MVVVFLGPTAQVSDRVGDAGVRPIKRAAHQLELRDQSVVAFQELITFLGELFVEFFELVHPALQARDVAFPRAEECARRARTLRPVPGELHDVIAQRGVAAAALLILFRHPGVNAIVQCGILYDVTRAPRTVINCYELR